MPNVVTSARSPPYRRCATPIQCGIHQPFRAKPAIVGSSLHGAHVAGHDGRRRRSPHRRVRRRDRRALRGLTPDRHAAATLNCRTRAPADRLRQFTSRGRRCCRSVGASALTRSMARFGAGRRHNRDAGRSRECRRPRRAVEHASSMASSRRTSLSDSIQAERCRRSGASGGPSPTHRPRCHPRSAAAGPGTAGPRTRRRPSPRGSAARRALPRIGRLRRPSASRRCGLMTRSGADDRRDRGSAQAPTTRSPPIRRAFGCATYPRRRRPARCLGQHRSDTTISGRARTDDRDVLARGPLRTERNGSSSSSWSKTARPIGSVGWHRRRTAPTPSRRRSTSGSS